MAVEMGLQYPRSCLRYSLRPIRVSAGTRSVARIPGVVNVAACCNQVPPCSYEYIVMVEGLVVSRAVRPATTDRLLSSMRAPPLGPVISRSLVIA